MALGVAAVSILGKNIKTVLSEVTFQSGYFSLSWFNFFHHFGSIKTKCLKCFHGIIRLVSKQLNKRYSVKYGYNFLREIIEKKALFLVLYG